MWLSCKHQDTSVQPAFNLKTNLLAFKHLEKIVQRFSFGDFGRKIRHLSYSSQQDSGIPEQLFPVLSLRQIFSRIFAMLEGVSIAFLCATSLCSAVHTASLFPCDRKGLTECPLACSRQTSCGDKVMQGVNPHFLPSSP